MDIWPILKWVVAVFLIIILASVITMGVKRYDNFRVVITQFINPTCEETGYRLNEMSKEFSELVNRGDYKGAIRFYDSHGACFKYESLKLDDEIKNKFCERIPLRNAVSELITDFSMSNTFDQPEDFFQTEDLIDKTRIFCGLGK